jgi:hypothetical protein
MTQEEKQFFMDTQPPIIRAGLKHLVGQMLEDIKVEIVPAVKIPLRVNDFPHDEDVQVTLFFEGGAFVRFTVARGSGWVDIHPHYRPAPKLKRGGTESGKHGRTEG